MKDRHSAFTSRMGLPDILPYAWEINGGYAPTEDIHLATQSGPMPQHDFLSINRRVV